MDFVSGKSSSSCLNKVLTGVKTRFFCRFSLVIILPDSTAEVSVSVCLIIVVLDSDSW